MGIIKNSYSVNKFYRKWKSTFEFEKDRPHLFIVRGFPGSGKSQFSRLLARDFGIIHIEPDQFITHCGEYKYTKNKYRNAIRRCLDFIYDNIDKMDIIISDVFPRIRDVAEVIAQVEYVNARVVVIDLPYISKQESKNRNRHDVSKEDLNFMYKNYQKWKDESIEKGGCEL